MKAIAADFISPVRPRTSILALLAAVAAAACALAFDAWQARQTLAEIRRAQQQARESGVLSDASRAEPLLVAPPAYGVSARQLLGERSTNWPQALRVLENVQMAGVQVQAFDLGSADRLVRVEIAAPRHATAMEYLAALSEGDQGDVRWVLTRSVASEGQAVRALLLSQPATASPQR